MVGGALTPTQAAALFREELPAGVQLLLTDFDRGPLSHAPLNATDMDDHQHWIEVR